MLLESSWNPLAPGHPSGSYDFPTEAAQALFPDITAESYAKAHEEYVIKKKRSVAAAD